MRAAFVAVGSELLGSERVDTNSLRVAAACARHGVTLVGKAVVGDDEEAIATELRRWAGAVGLVVVSGGLGPTEDDRTRQATARAFGRSLQLREELVEDLRRRFAAFGWEMPEVNRRQAEVVDGAEVLDNPAGTAPGQRLADGDVTVFLLPGVPRELEVMIARHLEPWLAERGDADGVPARATVKVACLGESAVEERLGPFYARWGRDAIAVYASPGEVRVVVAAAAGGEAGRREAEARAREVAAAIGDAVFACRVDGEGDDLDLETVTVRLLAERGRTVTTAESCTGGLLGARLTRVPGASDVYLGGVVSYADGLKTALLGVPPAMLEEHGAVSEPVAVAMARGVRERWGGDYGIGVTGVAGPGGGSEAKPVGTVHVALAPPDGAPVHRRARIPGDREKIRHQTATLALDLLRRHLVGEGA